MSLQFNFGGRYKIIRFGGNVNPKEAAHDHLKTMIEEMEDLYPGIDKWYAKKVTPNLLTGERTGLLVYQDDIPVGSAIIRNGDDAKFCSMRIRPEYQTRGIGSLLMARVGYELRKESPKGLYFTLPEDVWAEFANFFTEYGFECNGKADKQYRHNIGELACSADYEVFWKKVRETLPSLQVDINLSEGQPLPEILMSVRPKYVDKILDGSKTIEVRKSFPKRWRGARVVFYSSKKVQVLAGEATIGEIEIDSPGAIWKKYSENIGCSVEEYRKYCGVSHKISALKFIDVKDYRIKLPRSQLEYLLRNELTPPQSYSIINNNKDWLAAVSLSSVLRAGA